MYGASWDWTSRCSCCWASCLYALCIMGLNTLELLFLLSLVRELADSKRVSWNKVLRAFYKFLYCHTLHTNFYTPQAYSYVGHCQFVAHWCSLSYTGSRNARSIVAMETGLHVEGHRLIRNTWTNYSEGVNQKGANMWPFVRFYTRVPSESEHLAGLQNKNLKCQPIITKQLPCQYQRPTLCLSLLFVTYSRMIPTPPEIPAVSRM
jgi:hypothetical protein